MTITPVILAIDQGTTNTKAVLVDSAGAIVARASVPLSIAYPRPAWVEQDPEEIWRSVTTAMEQVLAAAGHPALAAIGISNQRESAILWDRRTGAALGPCAVWQCRRSEPLCAALRQRNIEGAIRERSGLQLDPLFSAGKIRWLIDNHAAGRAGADLCTGTVDSWLLWKLTGGAVHSTDTTNASRTQLLNLRTCQWDAFLREAFGIPAEALPEVRPSSSLFGRTLAHGSLPADVPIAAMVGDSHAALFAHRAFHPGAVKATYGTGSSLMTPTLAPLASSNGLSSTVAWSTCSAVTYALEGNISVTGSAMQWVAALVGADGGGAGAAALADTVESSEGVVLVPAFVGLGAPYWDPAARGLLTGITRATTGAHVARAALESIAFQVRDVFDAMEKDSGVPLRELLADGGAAANPSLMQFQADIIGRPVVRAGSPELSALGAAFLAGLAAGVWPGTPELESLPSPVVRFEPRMSEQERARRYDDWKQAVARAVHHGAGSTVSVER
jgi:glycerol kinase